MPFSISLGCLDSFPLLCTQASISPQNHSRISHLTNIVFTPRLKQNQQVKPIQTQLLEVSWDSKLRIKDVVS